MRLLVCFACCALVLTAPAAWAGHEGYQHLVKDKRGFWRPIRTFAARPSIRSTSAFPVSPSEARLIGDKLARLVAVFNQTKPLNPPMGLEVHPSAFIGLPYRWEQRGRPGPVPSHVRIFFFTYLRACDTCKVVRAPEADITIYVSMNNIGAIGSWGQPRWQDEQGGMFFEPHTVGEVAGFPQYDSGFIALTRIKRPLWVSVSQERFIRHEIRDWKAKLVEYEKARSESPYQRWVRERERRLRDVEKAYRELKKSDPNTAETFRQTAAKAEKEAEDQLKSEDARFLSDQRKAGEALQQRVRDLESELASLSPAARGSPAYWSPDTKNPRRSGLVDAGSKDARPVAAPNKAFFDLGRPRTSLQLIAIGWSPWVPTGPSFTGPNSVFFEQTLAETLRTLNWKSLVTILN